MLNFSGSVSLLERLGIPNLLVWLIFIHNTMYSVKHGEFWQLANYEEHLKYVYTCSSPNRISSSQSRCYGFSPPRISETIRNHTRGGGTPSCRLLLTAVTQDMSELQKT